MSVIQVGLADSTGTIDPELVRAAAAALNVQVTRDLPQFWHVHATVIYLPNAKHVPSGVWPVKLVGNLPPDEGGFHLDKHNQPYAKVEASPNSDGWTVAASHEILEMLVDPYGNRIQSARSIQIVGGVVKDGPSEFGYLVEACDPCEADQYSYSIQGIVVSDFITPRFYDPLKTPGTRYSFTGAITAPRQILPGGYISWVNQETDRWQQLQYLDPNRPPVIKDLGPASTKSLRSWIHTKNSGTKGLDDPRTISKKPKNKALFEVTTERRANLAAIAVRRAALSKR